MINEIIKNPHKRQNDLRLIDPKFLPFIHLLLNDCRHHNLPFVVFETGRTIERQETLVKNKVSWTMKSKHLVEIVDNNIVRYSNAIDLVLFYDRKYSWANIGDYAQQRRDLSMYKMLVQMVSRYNEFDIVCGGNWKTPDYPHFEFYERS